MFDEHIFVLQSFSNLSVVLLPTNVVTIGANNEFYLFLLWPCFIESGWKSKYGIKKKKKYWITETFLWRGTYFNYYGRSRTIKKKRMTNEMKMTLFFILDISRATIFLCSSWNRYCTWQSRGLYSLLFPAFFYSLVGNINSINVYVFIWKPLDKERGAKNKNEINDWLEPVLN